MWPFEAEIGAEGVLVAEIYPRVAYAEAFGTPLIKKTDRAARVDALARVAADVRVMSPQEAAANDDEFDACGTAIAILKRLLAGTPLVTSQPDAVFEGGILLA